MEHLLSEKTKVNVIICKLNRMKDRATSIQTGVSKSQVNYLWDKCKSLHIVQNMWNKYGRPRAFIAIEELDIYLYSLFNIYLTAQDIANSMP